MRLRRLIPSVTAAMLLLPAAHAPAAIFDVNKTADTADGVCNADCSLRDAVLNSNTNGTGHDDILLDAATYNLAAGELAILGDVDVEGTGAGSTVIAQTGASRVFRVANGGNPASFIGVTITGGNVNGSGGGILSEPGSGTLLIDESVIRNNRSSTSGAGPAGGGGIFNDGGALTVEDSAVSGNTATATGAGGANGGGGIHETGSSGLTLERSLVNANTATVSGTSSGGGGIRLGSGVTMTDSTLDGNRLNVSGLAPSSGGGGYFTAAGGGVQRHLTISSNSAGLPGGGLFNASGLAVPLQNTIIAFNSASGPGTANCSGAVSSSGNNIENADTCNLTDPQDRRNTDPRIGPLADNDGPTQTRALLPGSPAIDAGDGSFCTIFDQRGVDRAQGSQCDIGAYEFDGLAQAAIPDCSPTGQIGVTVTAPPGESADSLVYKVDGGPDQSVGLPGGSQESTTLTFSEGRRTLEYWGIFSGEEEEEHHFATVLVDQTRPNVNVESAQRRSIYVIRRRASVNVQAADALSGLVGNPAGNGQPISTLRRGRQTVAHTATDLCGNQATDAFAYRVLGPGLGVRAVVEELSGSVRVRSGGSSRSAEAAQKGRRFSALRQPREIPIGTLIDTSRGRARITSSTTRGTRIQDGQFSAGLFQVLQSRRRRARGLTELRLKGSSFRRCGRGRASAHSAASRRIRRLRANARGRFRTRGRHSAATVRGTVWETADRCDGTLTKVSRGRVAVRDFRRKRTVTVRAGKSYLARAP